MCEALRDIMREDFEAVEAKGKAEGKAEGETIIALLFTKLKDLGRADDAFRAAADPEYRQKLYKEFKLA